MMAASSSLDDARVFMLGLSERTQLRPTWQYAGELVLKAAEDNRAGVKNAWAHLRRALIGEGLAANDPFDAEAPAHLREAFDLALAKLPPELQTPVGKGVVEEVIKHVAKQGETEPLKLSERALEVLHGRT
jgi:hypothetical protein